MMEKKLFIVDLNKLFVIQTILEDAAKDAETDGEPRAAADIRVLATQVKDLIEYFTAATEGQPGQETNA
jgi:hypothetical protein